METHKKDVIKVFLTIFIVFSSIVFCSVFSKVDYIDKAKNCNVLVEGVTDCNGLIIDYWMGSGVIISKDGNIVTAKHCVEGATKVKITLQNGNSYYVYDYFFDDTSDVAIIDIPGEDYIFSDIGNSNSIRPGDKVYNVGNALGLWENTVIYGKVYKNHFKRIIFPDTEFIFLEMSVYGGCSGGGLYRGGLLEGIVVMGGENITLAVPSSIISNLYDKYIMYNDFEKIADYFLWN